MTMETGRLDKIDIILYINVSKCVSLVQETTDNLVRTTESEHSTSTCLSVIGHCQVSHSGWHYSTYGWIWVSMLGLDWRPEYMMFLTS